MLFKLSTFMSYGCNLLLFLFGSLGIFSSTKYYCTLHSEPLGERDHQWIVSANTQLHLYDRLQTEEIPVKKHFGIPIKYFMDYASSVVSANHCEYIMCY